MTNRLKNEKSPYLLQHSDNPVHWYPWCEEAFSIATKEDKPILLSIGYSTCHWCHVMAHESFEDTEVAALLNRDFISIKVDREERPDIDSVYMSVCQAVNGSGGWPLTIFMTPDQKPFFAGTYLPKRSNARQYGFMELLERISELWYGDRSELLATGNIITRQLNEPQSFEQHLADRSLLHLAYQQFRKCFDDHWGGFGVPPKFPTPHNLLFLLRYGQLEQKKNAIQMVETTLNAMARGGIQDHIGGGFSRYSTDGAWLVPHFEKMLYDNALLILAYLKAYQLTQKAAYADIVYRTADYVLRELTDKSGGFFCGQDADSDGTEGKYYTFTTAEIKNVLGEQDGTEFCQRYGISQSGNFDGKSIPNRIGQSADSWDKDDARLKKLYEYRLARTVLHKDDKILLSWNAWMILALARAGQVLENERYLRAAMMAHRFIHEHMTNEAGELYLRYREGDAAHAGQLDDYAVYALASLELYHATFDTQYLQEAILRAEQMNNLFPDKENGGYFMTADNAEQLIARPKETYDGAIPSGNSVAAAVLQALASLTAEIRWQDMADRQFFFLAGAIKQIPLGHSFALLAMTDMLYPRRELVCVSREGLPPALAAFLKTAAADNLWVLLKTADTADTLSQCAPFTRDYPIPDQGAVYYLCENGSCHAPTSDFDALRL